MPKKKIYIVFFVLVFLVALTVVFVVISSKSKKSINAGEINNTFGKYLNESTSMQKSGNSEETVNIPSSDEMNSFITLKEVLTTYKDSGLFDYKKLHFSNYDEVSKILSINYDEQVVDLQVLSKKDSTSQLQEKRTVKFNCELSSSHFLNDVEDLSKCFKETPNGLEEYSLGCISTDTYVAYNCNDLGCDFGIKDCIFYY